MTPTTLTTTQRSSPFDLIPTELLNEILGHIVRYHEVGNEKEYVDVTTLANLANVCTTWANVAAYFAQTRPQFRFSRLCHPAILQMLLDASHPNPLSIFLDFPERLHAAHYWQYLIALFRYSERFIELSVSAASCNYPSLYRCLLHPNFPLIETLRFIKVVESPSYGRGFNDLLSQSSHEDDVALPLPSLGVDPSKLRHIHIDGMTWHGPRHSRAFTQLESLFVCNTYLQWLSMSTLSSLKKLTISEMRNSSFLFRHADTLPRVSSITHLKIETCSPSFIFQEFPKSSITTLILSKLRATDWIDVARYIQASDANVNSNSTPPSPSSSPPSLSNLLYESNSTFSNVRTLEISFLDKGSASYGANAQKLYSRFYRTFPKLEKLVVTNAHREEYFLRPLKGAGVCPALKEIVVNDRKISRSNL